MTAAATNHNTTAMGEHHDIDLLVLPVAAAKHIYAGTLVVINSTAAGFAAPGITATTLTAVGRAEEEKDNSSGAAGDLTVKVRRGVFRFANSSAGDLIAAAQVGTTCYVVDDLTVAKTDGTGTRSSAGTVFGVDSFGVFVRVGF